MENTLNKSPKKNACRKIQGIFTLVYSVLVIYLCVFALPDFNLTGSRILNNIWGTSLRVFFGLSGLYVLFDFFIFSRIKHRARYLLILAFLCLILILTDRTVGIERSKNPDLYRYSPTLGWEMSPGIKNWQEGPHRRHIIDTNSMGFRSPEIEFKKPDGEFRIVVLGHSVAFGGGVANEDVFTNLLGEKIGVLYPDSNIRIINCSVSGYNLLQMERLMHEKGWKLEPDLVMILFNFAVPCSQNPIDAKDPRPRAWLRPVFSLLYRSWIFHERIAVKDFFFRELYVDFESGRKRPGRTMEFLISGDDFIGSLEKLLRQAKKKEVKTILITLPNTSDEPAIKDIAGNNNALFWDISQLWKRTGESDRLMDDRIHLSEKGHRVLAEDLLEFMKTEGLLNRRGGN